MDSSEDLYDIPVRKDSRDIIEEVEQTPQIPNDPLDKIKLKSRITEANSEEDIRRKNEYSSKEDPISDKALAMKEENSTTKSTDQTTQKALCAKELEECLEFKLISDTNVISSKESRNIVCGIHLKVNQLQQQRDRIPMDLVCVIDDSGSMGGKKAQLVRKSLKYLLKIMNEDDRISLISFDDNAKILTPFLRNNLNNKPTFKKAIKFIQGRGSTNIEIGMESGLWMIKNRQQKNPVTCLFLLSDGQDDNPEVNLRVQKLIQTYNIKDNFIVNTYGYGSDHDATQMRHMAETHKGGYYYIEDVKKVSEWFVLSISGLLSAVGEELRIKIKQKNKQQTAMTLTQLYGGEQLWVKSNNIKGEAELYLPHLIVGDEKYFSFDVAFDHTKFVLNDSTRNLIGFEADFEVKAVKQESIVRLNRILEFEFKDIDIKDIKENNNENYYEELVVTRQRAVGGLRIKQANALINEKKDYEQAKVVLQGYRQEIEKMDNNIRSKNVGIKHLDEDIVDAINKCSPRLYRKASFEKMEVIHAQRRNSISHEEDWNEEQQVVMKKFKNKGICLSDDSCSDDEDDDQQQQKPVQKNIFMRRRNSGNSVSSDDDEDDQQKPPQKIVQKNVQSRRFSPVFRRNNSDSDDS